MNKITSEIIKALKNRLPGRNAQLKMAPMNRARINLDDIEIQTYRKSAVMILFCEDENQNIFIPLIERMSYDGVHSGQISFPGGKFDIDDVDLKNTALRECLEEIGIIDADIIGELSDLPIPVSKFLVKPARFAICKLFSVVFGRNKNLKSFSLFKICFPVNSSTHEAH